MREKRFIERLLLRGRIGGWRLKVETLDLIITLNKKSLARNKALPSKWQGENPYFNSQTSMFVILHQVPESLFVPESNVSAREPEANIPSILL